MRKAATDATATSFVNSSGSQVGRVNMRALQQASGSREVELPRHDLASIIVPATRSGIAARNLASRLWPIAAATAWVLNRISPRPKPSQVTA